MTELFSRRNFLFTIGAAISMGVLGKQSAHIGAAPEVPFALDHILLGIDDLDRGIAFVEERTGVRAAFGGVHPGRGTRNALLRLGARRYLEIIAPDPKQSSLAAYPGLRQMREPHLLTWAVHTDNIVEVAKKLGAEGIEIEGPEDGSRTRPDGKALHWKALRLKDDNGGLLPFFIEWSRRSLHPSADAPPGCSLMGFSAASNDPEGLRKAYAQMGLTVQVEGASKPQLRAQIKSAKGILDLSS